MQLFVCFIKKDIVAAVSIICKLFLLYISKLRAIRTACIDVLNTVLETVLVFGFVELNYILLHVFTIFVAVL